MTVEIRYQELYSKDSTKIASQGLLNLRSIDSSHGGGLYQ